MSKDNQREFRKLKKDLKQTGNKKVRKQAKDFLSRNPEEAQDFEGDYGNCRTKEMNGFFIKIKESKKTDDIN